MGFKGFDLVLSNQKLVFLVLSRLQDFGLISWLVLL